MRKQRPKWPDDTSTKRQHLDRHWAKAGSLANVIHGAEQGQELPTNRRIGLKGNIVESQRQIFRRTMNCQVYQVSLDFKKSALLNLDVRMPPMVRVPGTRPAPAPVADRVTGESQWNPADVSNARGFFLKKAMLPLRRQNREETIMTDVLQVREAELLAPGARRFGHCDAVFLHELAIDGAGVLARRNAAGYIPPVAMTQKGTSDLLDETGHRNDFGTILHVPHQS